MDGMIKPLQRGSIMLFLLLACTDLVVPASYLSVLTVNPSQGAVNVPVDADLRVIFSADLENPSAQQVSLSTAEGTAVPTALRWFKDSGNLLIIDPIENLSTDTDYVLTLSSDLGSQIGNLSAQVENSFSTGNQSEGDSDTDTDADTDADADADSDSDADTDAAFVPYALGLTVLAAWNGESLMSWEDETGTFRTSYASFTFYEEEYFDTADERYACTWQGTIQSQGSARIDAEAYAALLVRFSDAGTSTCSGFPLAWGQDRTPTEILTSQDYGLAFTPISDDFQTDLRTAVEAEGGSWSDWEPYVFSTQFGILEGDSLGWQELSYAYALDLNEDGALSSDPAPVESNQGIEGELIYAQPWYVSQVATWTD